METRDLKQSRRLALARDDALERLWLPNGTGWRKIVEQ